MLDYLGCDGHVKAPVANRRRIVVHSEVVKYQLWRRILCEPKGLGAWFATDHFVSATGKLAAQRTIATSNVHDTTCAQLPTETNDVPPQVGLRMRRPRRSGVMLRCMTTGGAHCYVLPRACALISRSFRTISHSYQARSRQYVKPALPSKIPPRNKYM